MRKKNRRGKHEYDHNCDKKKKRGKHEYDHNCDIIPTTLNHSTVSSLFDYDDNILCEILKRLPVKSLTRFKCVCKRWKSLIQEDEYLINSHLTLSKARPCLLIVGSVRNKNRDYFSSADLLLEENNDRAAAVFDTTKDASFTGEHVMLGPVNGLVCFFSWNRFAIRVYNLSTREVTSWIETTIKQEREEAKEDGDSSVMVQYEPPSFEFGYDPATKKHKVICVCNMLKKRSTEPNKGELLSKVRVCEVLTVGHKSWRRIDAVPPYDVKGASVYANGSIYWRKLKLYEWGPTICHPLEDGEPENILAFDVGSEKFRVIHIPNFILEQPPNCEVPLATSVDLLQVDGCVTLLHRISGYTVKLWMFHDDDKKDNNTISNNWIEETINLPFRWDLMQSLTFKAVAGTNKLIVHSAKIGIFRSLLSYDRKSKTFKKLESNGISHRMLSSCFLVTTFEESLLPVHEKQQHHSSTQPPSFKTFKKRYLPVQKQQHYGYRPQPCKQMQLHRCTQPPL